MSGCSYINRSNFYSTRNPNNRDYGVTPPSNVNAFRSAEQYTIVRGGYGGCTYIVNDNYGGSPSSENNSGTPYSRCGNGFTNGKSFGG